MFIHPSQKVYLKKAFYLQKNTVIYPMKMLESLLKICERFRTSCCISPAIVKKLEILPEKFLKIVGKIR